MTEGFGGCIAFVIGEHLSHSFSPIIHSMLADYSYGILELPREKLGDFMKNGKFDFVNVTIPYKKDVIPFLDSLSPEAEKIGAVNTVIRSKDGRLTGYNTDYFGFEYLLKKSGIECAGKKVLILGSGGASRPVRAVFEDNGASQIIVVSRTGAVNYENIYTHNDADIIVNTTPVGMYPDNGSTPCDLSMFGHCRGVIDIIYNPERTKLLLDAERLGIPFAGGLTMLVAQAQKACELFTGVKTDGSEISEIVHRISFDTRNIILIGMPGCGKSTVGALLAEKLDREFIDADEEFTRVNGISPADAMGRFGEEKFRHMEHEVINSVGKLSGRVIATGGGAVTRDDNYAPLHQNGVIVYLQRDLSRLAVDGRPISQSLGVGEIFRRRRAFYEKFADITVSCNDAPEEAANEIISVLKGRKDK